jgi:hypothetical protein
MRRNASRSFGAALRGGVAAQAASKHSQIRAVARKRAAKPDT